MNFTRGFKNNGPVVSENERKAIEIWIKVQEHYGFQTTGLRFLDFSYIQWQAWEELEDFCQSIVLFWTPIFRQKGVLWFHHCQYVSMSVDKLIFSKRDHRIFLKLLMKFECLKGKKLTTLGKNLILGIMPKSTPKIGFFGFCEKNSPLMYRFFGFKPCTRMAFMILLKLHVWEKSGSQAKCKNVLNQSDCRIFELQYLKNY